MTEGPRPGSLSARLAEHATVLVVEDEPDIAAFLAAYFKASGLGLEHVDPASIAEVDDAIERHRPRCVLLDLHLRGLSGLDVYRHLRSDPAHGLLPVIIVTADSRASVREEAVKGGVDGFVTKPFNVKNLFELVRQRISDADLRAEVGPSPATADAVTGVGTHSWVHDRLADEISLAAHTGRPVSFALVRVRSLRATNAELGFAAGDVVLRAVAQRLVGALPGDATVGRNAGDEFAVVLPALAPDAAHDTLATAVRTAWQVVEVPGAGPAPVELVAGIAAYPAAGSTSDEIEMAADVALADAIERGEPLVAAR